MYSSSVTARWNKAMLKRKELKRDDRTIQASVKCPTILFVKKSNERSYSAYAEFLSCFCLGFSVSQYVYFAMFGKVIVVGKIFTNAAYQIG